MSRIKFLYGAASLASKEPQFRRRVHDVLAQGSRNHARVRRRGVRGSRVRAAEALRLHSFAKILLS